jgi:anti-anti-sigma factor
MEKGGLVLTHEPIRDHPDAARVVLEGSIDPKTTLQLKDELLAIAAKGTKRFFLDCAKLTYINSSGLAFLLNLAGSVKPKGGCIALTAVDSKILVVFKMMGIMEIFQFYPSFAEALRDVDEKLARELRDVGPALKLEEPPPPPPPPAAKPARPASTPRPTARIEMIRKSTRRISPVVSENPIVRFFRALFGIEEESSWQSSFRRANRKRR